MTVARGRGGEGSSQQSYDRWGGGGGEEEGGLVRPGTLGPSSLPPGPVRPAQYKARGLVAGLKKN